MKILLLGGNGYIGSRLYTHFKLKKYEIDNVDLCWYGKIIVTEHIKSNIYNLVSFSNSILDLAKSIQQLNDCKLIVNENLLTSYSFTVTNNKFESVFKFKFIDIIESIYNELKENFRTVKLKSNRSKSYVP